MPLLYDILLKSYETAIRAAAAWNPKAGEWVEGRRGLLDRLERRIATLPPSSKTLWMHCSSQGEFEQGRPVLEALRNRYPDCRIVLTFFSPSGYMHRKDYPGADLVSYLPMDGKANAARFISLVDPDVAVFVKYEYWHHYLGALRDRKIPSLLISAIFREGQPFFKPWGGFWRRMLDCHARIFVQDAASLRLLEGIGLAGKAEMAGDTRFDRVIAVAEQAAELAVLKTATEGRKVLVAGSTWEEDEAIIAAYAAKRPDLAFIIVPHETDDPHIGRMLRMFPTAVRFSRIAEGKQDADAPGPVIVVDRMGLLSRLYRLADITFVGGGFNRAGIHNILEAVVYGKPVLFGPEHRKSREAQELVVSGGAFPISDAGGFTGVMDRLLTDAPLREAIGRANAAYVRQGSGATGRILDHIQENRLLTS